MSLLNAEVWNLGLKMPLVRFFLGIILLTMGSRVFWLFIGVVGFIFGFDSAGRLFPHQPHDILLVAALIMGFICSFLAVSLQKIAITIGGFLAGGHLLPELLNIFGIATQQHYWVFFIVGGISGAVLMRLAFDFVLTVLSSLLGANLILHALNFKGKVFSVLFVILTALGFALQYGLFRPKPLRH